MVAKIGYLSLYANRGKGAFEEFLEDAGQRGNADGFKQTGAPQRGSYYGAAW